MSIVVEWPRTSWVEHSMPEPAMLFGDSVMGQKLPVLRRANWPTETADLEGLGEPEMLLVTEHGQDAVLWADGALLRVVLEHGLVNIAVAAMTIERVDQAVEMLRSVFPPTTASDGRVPVTFWTYGPHGAQSIVRKIAVADWDSVAVNYPGLTGCSLSGMMRDFRPSHGGQLRALAWEWRDWATLHYVVDPDRLFGENADYLISVLLDGELDGDEDRKWKLLVLEDTGELLAADAKNRTGQGLSRLLNTVDGLIGQGLRILVLVTTNEELKRLHPAVQRPGRCAMQLTFDRFDAKEAQAWLQANDVEDGHAAGLSLAELYAVVDGFADRPRERAVGFAR